jgi:hypothetical protein
MFGELCTDVGAVEEKITDRQPRRCVDINTREYPVAAVAARPPIRFILWGIQRRAALLPSKAPWSPPAAAGVQWPARRHLGISANSTPICGPLAGSEPDKPAGVWAGGAGVFRASARRTMDRGAARGARGGAVGVRRRAPTSCRAVLEGIAFRHRRGVRGRMLADAGATRAGAASASPAAPAAIRCLPASALADGPLGHSVERP